MEIDNFKTYYSFVHSKTLVNYVEQYFKLNTLYNFQYVEILSIDWKDYNDFVDLTVHIVNFEEEQLIHIEINIYEFEKLLVEYIGGEANGK